MLVYRYMIPIVLLFLLWPPSAPAQITVYVDETAFLNDLSQLGYRTIVEGFECFAWDIARSQTAPSILSQTITWTPNDIANGIITGSGAARSGNWGVYSLPHNPNGDGFIGTGAVTLYGVGGWFETNTPPAKLGLILDGDELNPVDFPEICEIDEFGEEFNCVDRLLTSQPQFFGVINTDGFTFFEFRELEGKPGDLKYIYADDFTFAVLSDTFLLGDYTGDAKVNLADLFQLSLYWLQDFSAVNIFPPTDGRCRLSLQEFAVLAQNWLAGTI